MDREKILLVDDEPQNLQLLRQILREDYHLLYARSGADALEIAVAQQPRLILLDVMMPGMDGFEVCRALKQNPATGHIPVIFVSAMAGSDNKLKALQLGAVDYIVKPAQPALVRMRVQNQLVAL